MKIPDPTVQSSGFPRAAALSMVFLATASVMAFPSFAVAGPIAKLLGGLRLDAATSAQSAHLSVSGAPAGSSFQWIVTTPSGATASTKPATPVTTVDPFLQNLSFAAPGGYNAQVLLTVPGERVIGTASSVVVGPPSPTPSPTARMSAAFVLPEVGDEVLFDLRQSTAGATPTYSVAFGDGSTATFTGGRVQHTYAEAGWYRATATVTAAGGASASVYLDLVVVEPTAMVSDEKLKFAACMVDLRASAGAWTCRDRSNPLNDAVKLAAGDVPNTNGCVAAPTMTGDGWRCLTPQAMRRCRAYANGHRHLGSYPIRHCQLEAQPEELSFPTVGEFQGTLDDDAWMGIDLVATTEAVIDLVPSTPGPPSVPGTCDPVVAAHFGRTCDVTCEQSYYTFAMPPSGPDLPVIQGLACGAKFRISLDEGLASLGDFHEQAAASCAALVPNVGDPAVLYETAIWTDVTSHFIWRVPRTEEWFDGQVWNRTYTDEPHDVAAERVSVSAPARVTCQR